MDHDSKRTASFQPSIKTTVKLLAWDPKDGGTVQKITVIPKLTFLDPSKSLHFSHIFAILYQIRYRGV